MSPDPNGWVRVMLPLDGYVTVTNTGARPNAAAAAVVVQYNVAYQAQSTLCGLTDQTPARSLRGGYCWHFVGEVAPFSYSHGPPHSIEPGGGQVVDFGRPGSIGVALTVPATQLGDVVDQMSRPAAIVATTNDIPGLGPSFRFDGACIDPTHGPTSGSEPTAAPLPGEQHAIVGATTYLTCRDLPDLGP